MIKQIKEYFRKRRDYKKSVEYLKVIQAGGRFLEFIALDLDKQKSTLNRETRRRFEQQLEKNGKITTDMITYYAKKVDEILAYIKKNNPKG